MRETLSIELVVLNSFLELLVAAHEMDLPLRKIHSDWELLQAHVIRRRTVSRLQGFSNFFEVPLSFDVFLLGVEV